MSEHSEVPLPQPEQKKIQNHTPIDREKRRLLQWLGAAGATAVVAPFVSQSPARAEATHPTPTTESVEALKDSEGGLTIDFFNVDYFDTLIDTHLRTKGSSLEELKKELGLGDNFSEEDLRDTNPQAAEQETFVLMMFLKERYRKHGEVVVEIEKKVSDMLGVPADLYHESEKQDVTPAMSMGNLSTDTIGNPTLGLSLSEEYVAERIAQSPARDICMSLELGDFSITYEMYKEEIAYPDIAMQPPSKRGLKELDDSGYENIVDHYYDGKNNKITKEEYEDLEGKSKEKKSVLLEPKDRRFIINDGYYPEKAYSNLSRMVELAKKFPDKNFYVAGGNPLNQFKRPDLREARERIEKEQGMPANLRIVGVKGNEPSPYAASLGCDIYVDEFDLEKLDLPPMSSFATPMVKRVGTILLDRGKLPEDISDYFSLMSDNTSTLDDPADMESVEEMIDVININKVKRVLKIKK